MAATISPKNHKQDHFGILRSLYPAIDFTEGEVFSYSYGAQTVTYPKVGAYDTQFFYSLLHELGHAEALHNNFKNDLELIKLEREAWQNSIQIGQKIGVVIDPEHIEKCMDSYRDWIYARSLCPNCHQCGVQASLMKYSCPFCHNTWTVSKSRLCKVSRRFSVKK